MFTQEKSNFGFVFCEDEQKMDPEVDFCLFTLTPTHDKRNHHL